MTEHIDDLIRLIEGKETVLEVEVMEERNELYAYCVECDHIITTEKEDDHAVWIHGEIWICGKCWDLKMK